MSPITHFLISWSVACSANLGRRDRALVTLAGVLPDADGAGIAVDTLTRGTAHPTDLWSQWHHVLGHNLGFALFLTLAVLLLARRRALAAILAFACFSIHLFCDLIGARGPDGDQWPIPLLSPFYKDLSLSWGGQWALNAWPNFAITGACLLLLFYFAVKKGVSPIEMVSARANQAFVETLRSRLTRY
ncbi:MAG: metal-dependent hydrolase [Thermodesulfobacteriota bacterium]